MQAFSAALAGSRAAHMGELIIGWRGCRSRRLVWVERLDSGQDRFWISSGVWVRESP